MKIITFAKQVLGIKKGKTFKTNFFEILCNFLKKIEINKQMKDLYKITCSALQILAYYQAVLMNNKENNILRN